MAVHESLTLPDIHESFCYTHFETQYQLTPQMDNVEKFALLCIYKTTQRRPLFILFRAELNFLHKTIGYITLTP